MKKILYFPTYIYMLNNIVFMSCCPFYVIKINKLFIFTLVHVVKNKKVHNHITFVCFVINISFELFFNT